MAWLHFVAVLSLIQFIFFGVVVSVGRIKHGVQPPSMTGSADFEALVRVHQVVCNGASFYLLPAVLAQWTMLPSRFKLRSACK